MKKLSHRINESRFKRSAGYAGQTMSGFSEPYHDHKSYETSVIVMELRPWDMNMTVEDMTKAIIDMYNLTEVEGGPKYPKINDTDLVYVDSPTPTMALDTSTLGPKKGTWRMVFFTDNMADVNKVRSNLKRAGLGGHP